MPLGSIGRLFLPQESDTNLLRACLWQGDDARDAFSAWTQSPDFARMLSGDGAKRRLLPLLEASLDRSKISPPAELRTLLPAARMYEELRTRAYGNIACIVFQSLAAAKVPFLACRGVSLGIGLYREGEFRHCHDIDLLISEEDVSAAVDVLQRECDFKIGNDGPPGHGDFVLFHSSGLPLVLHRHSLQIPAYEFSFAELKGRAVMQRGYGTEFAALSPEDSFLHLILHAACARQGAGLIWVCDAWKLAASGSLDWARLTERESDSLRMLPVLYALEYLHEELLAPVPAPVLQQFRSAVGAFSVAQKRDAQEVIVFGLQNSFTGGRRALLRETAGLRQRILLLRCFLFPSAETLQSVGKIESPWQAPQYWSKRILRRLLRWLGRKAA
jgi:Uncharacterised nucleotidyltransferase